MGEQKPDSGTLDIGETVRFGYYSQDGLKFDEQMKVIDVVPGYCRSHRIGKWQEADRIPVPATFFCFTPRNTSIVMYIN